MTCACHQAQFSSIEMVSHNLFCPGWPGNSSYNLSLQNSLGCLLVKIGSH
jgi:hypothetical protein